MKHSKATRHVEPPSWPTVRCPGCLRSWLAAGVRRGDTYTCKACGQQFVVGKQETVGRPGLAPDTDRRPRTSLSGNLSSPSYGEGRGHD